MIPSFLPVHQRRAARAGGQALRTPIQIDPDTGLEQRTLDQILAEARDYRFVDGCHIDYDALVGVERANPNASPLSASGQAIAWPGPRAPSVLVVGGGLGGLLTAWQLRKAGLQVTLFEAYREPDSLNDTAGRIRTVQVLPGDPSTSAELGAMRFPTTSYLFWHYLACSGAAAPGAVFTAFPNVAGIPSAFSGKGSQLDSLSAVWDPGALALPTEFEQLNQRHLAAFNDYMPPGGPAGASIASIATLLKNAPGGSDVATIELFWSRCIAALYGISYHSFLVGAGFSESEITQIGYMGIGTGGFEPLFDVDVLDIMRLFLWGYSNEMAVPGLKQLPKKLFTLLQASQAGSHHRTPVLSVLYSPALKQYSVGYPSAGGITYSPGADFVVLAMTHVAAQRLLSRSPLYLLGNGFDPNAIVPFYDPRMPLHRSRIKPELNQQLAMSATKIFHTIAGPARQTTDTSLKPWVQAQPAAPNGYDHRLRSCYGTFAASADTVPIGVSYMLPRTNASLRASNHVIGLHYAWGKDADQVNSAVLQTTTAVKLAINASGVYQGRNTDAQQISGRVARAMQQRLNGFQAHGSLAGDVNGGLLAYFVPYRRPQPYAEEGWYAAVYWNKVPYVWGGFKLDQPGIGAYLAFAYKLVSNAVVEAHLWAWDQNVGSPGQPAYAVHPAIKGLYFAGDSFSNYGGWAEGAFQSALATAAGIVKSAAYRVFGSAYVNQVNMAAITALVDRARDPSSYASER